MIHTRNEDDYFFVSGLTDRYLKELFRAVKHELRERDLLTDPQPCIKVNNTPSTFSTVKKIREGTDIIIENRGEPICKIGQYRMKNKSLNLAIIDFLCEDWRFLFPNTDDIKKEYYVYYHTDPTELSLSYFKNEIKLNIYGRPFYIGKGKGDRYKSMHGRCTAHQRKVKNLLLHNIAPDKIFNILINGLTELEAFELESKLITFFGTMGEYGKSKPYFTSMHGGILLNSDIAKRPEWIEEIICRLNTRYYQKTRP